MGLKNWKEKIKQGFHLPNFLYFLMLISINRKFAAYTLLNAEQLALKEAAAQHVNECIKPDA